MAKLPDIPSIGTAEASVGVRRVFDAIRRAFSEINKSGGVETGSSVIDRIEQAVNSTTSGSSSTHTPPKPVNVAATGGFAYITVSWDDPYFAYLAYAEVWRSTGTVISGATRVGTTNATMFADLPPSQSISASYHYWVRFVSNDGTPQYGPWSDMVTASTADNPAYVLEVLAGEIETTQLHADLNSRINLIDTDTTSPLSVAKRLADEASARQSAISTEQTTRADADSAEVSARQALATKVTGFADPTGKVLANLTSGLIYEEKTIRSSETSSIASSVSTLSTTVSGHTSTIQTQQSSINGLYAQYTVKVDVNGKVSGFGLASTGDSSLFEIVADRFAICNTSGTGVKYPFVVDATYGVVMDSALIKDGTITNAKIYSLAVDKLYAASGTMAAAIIGTGHITNAMIGNYIASTNFDGSTTDPYGTPGTLGWCIAKSGGAAFHNVKVRGDIEATSLTSNIVTTDKIVNDAVTSKVCAYSETGPKLSSGAGTYTVQTATIVGTGKSIVISGQVTFSLYGESSSVKIYKGAALLATFQCPTVLMPTIEAYTTGVSGTFPVVYEDPYITGSTTYTIRVTKPRTTNSCPTYNVALMLKEFKK